MVILEASLTYILGSFSNSDPSNIVIYNTVPGHFLVLTLTGVIF